MDSHRKSRFIGISLLLFACLATGAAGDNQCENINTEISSTFSAPLLESDWHLHNGDHSQRDNKGDYEFYSSELSSRPCTGDRGLHGDTFYHHEPGDIEYQRCRRPGHYKQRIQ